MWDKLNFFGWSKKKMSVQPVQRDISITLTNGDRKETIHRSPSGTKMASSSTANAKRGLEDDESSEGSTSLNFGFKAGAAGRRNSSYSFSREPLDLPTWSNVTSPGFTSRLVQQASGHSPLKEFNDSLSHSPFRKSPYKDLTLGELPYVSFSRKSRLSSPAFPSPNTSFKGGASSSMYNRDRRKHARQGQVFVRIAPIDPSIRANVLVARKSSSPTASSSPFPPRGSPRTGGEPYRNEGLGGIPQQELTMRFNRLWPHSPGSPVPGPGRPSSPTSPSNIMEALVAGRKRAREQDTFYPPNATPPSMSPPTKISVGIQGDTPVRPQMSKRVKFVGGPEGHDRPMMVAYSGIGGGDTEPLSSESILEQMNQTEKRFLPDSTSTPYSFQKKPIRTTEEQSSNLMRKRRSQTNLMSVIEDEPRSEKVGRFCACNDCYAESTGSMLHSPSGSPSKCHSSGKSDEKGTNTGESRSKETCDKGVSTDSDQGEYFRGIFRNADRFKNLSASEQPEGSKDDIMKFGKLVYTKEMHDRDKRKRIERYYRLLKLKPPEDSSILDASQNRAESSDTTTNASSLTLGSAPLNGTGIGSGFNFGSPAATTSASGPLFGTQTSPIALTVTTSACTTITSPSSSAGNLTGSTISSVAPTASTTMSFGIGNAGIPTPAPVSALASPTPPIVSQNIFSSGSSTLAKPTQVDPSSTTTSTTNSASSTTTTGTGGFNFSSSSTFGSGSATAPSSIFGEGTATSNAGFGTSNAPPQTQSAAVGFGFSNTQSQPTDPLSTSSSSGGFPFGQSITNTPVSSFTQQASTQKSGAESTPFQFGQRATQDVPDVAKTQPEKNNTNVNAASLNPGSQTLGTTGLGFSFGATAASTTASATPLFGAHTSSSIAPTVTTSASITKATPFVAGSLAPPTNVSFGIGNPAPASTLTFSNPTSSDSGGTSLNAGSSLGQNMFSAGSSALAKPTQAEPSSTTNNATNPATTTTTGGFSFSDPSASTLATPTFGSVGATSPSSIFGGGSSTNNGFGPSFTTPSQAQSSGAGFGFGGSSNSQPPAQSTTSSGGFSFGQSTATVAPATGGFQFNQPANAGSTGGTATVPFQFGQGAQSVPAPATSQSNSSTPANRVTSSNTNSSLGQVMFPSVTNPLAKPKPTGLGLTPATNIKESAATTNAGGFNFSTPSTTATLSTPNFGNMTSTPASSPPSIFGGGTATTSAGFGFGQSSFTMSAPQSQNPTGGGFGFGANTTPQPSAPSAATPGGFPFGQAPPNPPPASSPGGALFQFGQQPTSPGTTSGAGFQFGQQAAQGVPGGFNFAASPQAGAGGPPMFNMGSASTAPRRRDIRRRHR